MFLLTYRNFISASDLFELFMCRAYATPSDGTDWTSQANSIRNRILVILGIWVEKYWFCDFSGNNRILYLLAHFMEFVSQHSKSTVFASLVNRGVGHQIIPPDMSSQSLRKLGFVLEPFRELGCLLLHKSPLSYALDY